MIEPTSAEFKALAEIIEETGLLRIEGETYIISRISPETLDTLRAFPAALEVPVEQFKGLNKPAVKLLKTPLRLVQEFNAIRSPDLRGRVYALVRAIAIMDAAHSA